MGRVYHSFVVLYKSLIWDGNNLAALVIGIPYAIVNMHDHFQQFIIIIFEIFKNIFQCFILVAEPKINIVMG
jgi:hypothetical protein